MSFDNNSLIQDLYGEHNSHLKYIENILEVSIADKSNNLFITGNSKDVQLSEDILLNLYDKLNSGGSVTTNDIDAALRFAKKNYSENDNENNGDKLNYGDELVIKTKKKTVAPRTPNQATYVRTIMENEAVFGLGPAGTGKTYLAVAVAVNMLITGKVEKLIFCRPAVEAGESLGFLPGDMKEKIDPYLRPIYDALHDMMPNEIADKKILTGDIEIAPLAFMRGRTLSNAFVILDEAQNTTQEQMKMFLTRLGQNSRMVITGDPTQIDLPNGQKSGLHDAVKILKNIDEIKFIQFSKNDVVRHKLVGKIIQAYEKKHKNSNAKD